MKTLSTLTNKTSKLLLAVGLGIISLPATSQNLQNNIAEKQEVVNQKSISEKTTIPSPISSFSALYINNNTVELRWNASFDSNVSHIMVERSADGVNYSDAGMVFTYSDPNDKTSYVFPDNVKNINSGNVFYRLRSVSNSGNSQGQYSEPVSMNISKLNRNTISIVAFPNPVVNELKITIPTEWQNKKVVYEVLNTSGLPAAKFETANSYQTESINTTKLGKGFYYVRVNCDGQIAQQKIMKN